MNESAMKNETGRGMNYNVQVLQPLAGGGTPVDDDDDDDDDDEPSP